MATLYAIRSAPGVPAQDDDEVVDEMDHGYACLEAAITLWRLVDPARAESLRSFLVRVADASEDHTQFAVDDHRRRGRADGLRAGVAWAVEGESLAAVEQDVRAVAVLCQP